jgi:hypothetical protein
VDSPVGVDPVDHELLPLEHAQRLPRRLHGATQRKLLRVAEQGVPHGVENQAADLLIGGAGQLMRLRLAARSRKDGEPGSKLNLRDEGLT